MTNNLFKITDGPGKKTSEILKEMRQKFDVWVYDEENVDKNFPAPKEETTRYFRKTVEADEEHKNKSADDLEKGGVKGITLRERLIMELQYFDETGSHLDINNWTLCSGSRYSDGYVPLTLWHYGGFKVGWHYRDERRPFLRPREAVNPKNLDFVPSKDLTSIPEIIKSHLGVIESEIEFIKNLLK